MRYEIGDGNTVSLTGDQKRILLVLCDAHDVKPCAPVKLVVRDGRPQIREMTTGNALVRKGLAIRLASGRYVTTLDGYWLADQLRIEDRQGRIPARRCAP